MSETTVVNQGAMATGMENLRRAQRELARITEELDRRVKSDLSDWEGAGREAYNAKQREWTNDKQVIENTIGKMEQVLSKISTGYQTNENNVAGGWGGN